MKSYKSGGSESLAGRMEELLNSEGFDGKFYGRGDMIYQPGDVDFSVYYIADTNGELNGKVKLAYRDRNGRKLTLHVLGEGELFGEMVLIGQRRRELLAQSLQVAKIYEIDKRRFLGYMEHEPWLALTVLELYGRRVRETEQRLIDLVFKDIPTRLSRVLLKLTEEHGRKTPET